MNYYKSQKAYIVSTGIFLPGDPVDNDKMESVLGLVAGKPSRVRKRILRSNGIKSRHYALNEKGQATHLTDKMSALSIQQALAAIDAEPDTLDMIAVGTTLPDLLAPGIASMVHGLVGGSNVDILSCAGICGAGAAAFKAAAMSVIAGQHQRVAASGVERPSVIMRGDRFKKESEAGAERDDLDKGESYRYFNADFLRWMLSDGAGSFLMDNKKNESGLSLEVNWIETSSFAHQLPTCMYMGTSNPESVSTDNTWLSSSNFMQAESLGMLLLRQDTTLLGANIIQILAEFAHQLTCRDFFKPEEIDWFLPHFSSFFFEDKLAQELERREVHIPLEKWFSNLRDKGNTGAASIYIMLDELFRSDKIQDGEKILLMIPESGRFSVTYAMLTAFRA